MITTDQARQSLVGIAAAAISATPDAGAADLRAEMGVVRDMLNETEATMELVSKVVHAYGTTRTESYETRHVDALFESVGKLADHLKED